MMSPVPGIGEFTVGILFLGAAALHTVLLRRLQKLRLDMMEWNWSDLPFMQLYYPTHYAATARSLLIAVWASGFVLVLLGGVGAALLWWAGKASL